MQPTLIVYGNCQSEAISVILDKDPTVSSHFRVVYAPSYNHPAGAVGLTPDEIAQCAYLFEQHDRQPFPRRDLLPADTVTIKFPSVDLPLLWPLNVVNPFNPPEPPAYPFGRFPYGDRILIGCVQRGMAAPDVVQYYLNSWDEYKPDLDRLFQLEQARLAVRDGQCDVKMRDYVFDRFRVERIAWTVNHPTKKLLHDLLERLLHAAFEPESPIRGAAIADTIAAHFPNSEPLGIAGVPIHPRVAEHFNLEWYDPDEKYALFDGRKVTSIEYLEEMTVHAISFAHAKESA